jgi:hypothetical protein
LDYLEEHGQEYLTPEALQTYSPKMLAMLKNMLDPDHIGNHLVYSQFRTMEGIGIFKLVLLENGFAEFRLKRRSGDNQWEIDMDPEDMQKPTFALYTGTEDTEMREIVRNIYNGQWESVPKNIIDVLQKTNKNGNMLGEIIKILMITSSGSEGINLRNTRYVHIMEPYWHPVRTEQVIGRARRICSHNDLPKDLQTVEVFVYLMTLTEKQKSGEESIELKLYDVSTVTPGKIVTTDEHLWEICERKEQINSQILDLVKQTSIDCAVYSKKTGIQCLSFGDPDPTQFSYVPNLAMQPNESLNKLNKKKMDWTAKPVTIQGTKYAARKMSKTLFRIYDLESFKNAVQLNQDSAKWIGNLELLPSGEKIFTTI